MENPILNTVVASLTTAVLYLFRKGEAETKARISYIEKTGKEVGELKGEIGELKGVQKGVTDAAEQTMKVVTAAILMTKEELAEKGEDLVRQDKD